MAAVPRPPPHEDYGDNDSQTQFSPHPIEVPEDLPSLTARADALALSRRVWDFVAAGKRKVSNHVPERARALSTFHAHNTHDLIKLEVISRREIDFIRWIQTIAVVYNIVYLTVVTCLARHRWVTDPNCTAVACNRQDFRAVIWFNFITVTIFVFVAFIYGCYFLYLYRICEQTRRPEVIWTIILLLPVVVTSNNPATNCDRIHVLGTVGPRTSSFLAMCRYGTVAYCIAAVSLYIILKFGALERVKDLDEPYSTSFYVWRTLPMIVVFAAFFTAAAVLRVEFSPQPIVSLISLARAGSAGTRFSKGVVSATVSTGIVLVFCVFVFLGRYAHISRHITRRSYVDMRLKVINVFFMFRHMFVPILITMTATAVCAALFPPSLTSIRRTSSSLTETIVLDVPYFARSGIVFVYCVIACIESFVMLPSSYQPTFMERLLIERLGLLAPKPFARCTDKDRDSTGIVETEKNVRSQPILNGAIFDLEHGSVSTEQALTIATESSGLDGITANRSAQSIQTTQKRLQMHGQQTRVSEESGNVPPIVWAAARDQSGRFVNGQKFTSSLRFDETILAYNMSWLAYLSDDAARSAVAENANALFSVHRIWREKTRDLVAMVLTSPEWLVVAFRGTVSLTNMRLNLQIFMEEQSPRDDPPWLEGKWRSPSWGCKHARIHTGFYDGYSSLRDDILATVREIAIQQPQRRILVCGHSLGGAMATQCAFDCRVILSVPEDRVTLITFGSPKVGNRSFARRFAVAVPDSFRLVNHSDFITNQPNSPVQIYDHVPRGVLIDAHGNVVVDPMFADLKLFHGNSASPHVLAAYKLSLQTFVDHAFEESSAGGQGDLGKFVPDWWDFSKFDQAVHEGNSNIPNPLEAETPSITADGQRDREGRRSSFIRSETRRSGTAPQTLDMELSAHPPQQITDRGVNDNSVDGEADLMRSPSTRMLNLAKNALGGIPISTKLTLEKLDILDLRNAQFREFDGTPYALLGTARSPEFAQIPAGSEPPNMAERNFNPDFSVPSKISSVRANAGFRLTPRVSGFPGSSTRAPRPSDTARMSTVRRSALASGALGTVCGTDLPTPASRS
jgi:pimeloyl-ACP methyl ester carboxylesterase